MSVGYLCAKKINPNFNFTMKCCHKWISCFKCYFHFAMLMVPVNLTSKCESSCQDVFARWNLNVRLANQYES